MVLNNTLLGPTMLFHVSKGRSKTTMKGEYHPETWGERALSIPSVGQFAHAPWLPRWVHTSTSPAWLLVPEQPGIVSVFCASLHLWIRTASHGENGIEKLYVGGSHQGDVTASGN